MGEQFRALDLGMLAKREVTDQREITELTEGTNPGSDDDVFDSRSTNPGSTRGNVESLRNLRGTLSGQNGESPRKSRSKEQSSSKERDLPETPTPKAASASSKDRSGDAYPQRRSNGVDPLSPETPNKAAVRRDGHGRRILRDGRVYV